MNNGTILTVTQLNQLVRDKLERDPMLQTVGVRGEISNYKLYPSGHHYFSLKDRDSAVRCVLFKGAASSLRFRPENGMSVVVLGRVSIYPKDGSYQIYCTHLIPDGIGDLHLAFEQLRARLDAEGLFDPARKKPLPPFPHSIGIITSPAGAAVHDMLRILGARYPLCRVILLPVRVQGAGAAEEIAAAIDTANRLKLADLLIVGRGGGSIEDLWAFNEEVVARAIWRSELPVISAVGHEPDVTISDYAADLRAATPSNAAELAVPDQGELRTRLQALQKHLAAALQRQAQTARRRLEALESRPVLRDPMRLLTDRRQRLDQAVEDLRTAQTARLREEKNRLAQLSAALDAMSPLKVLSRGYALVSNGPGQVITAAADTVPGQRIRITFRDGSVPAQITEE